MRLFILAGQSNMAALDETATLIPVLEKAFPDDELIVVKDAQSGQPIRRWYKDWKPVGNWKPRNNRAKPGNNDLYRRLMAAVNKAIEGRKPDTVSFMWMQGEADAKSGQTANYEESIKGLIKQLRDDLERRDMTVVVGRLSDHQKGREHWDAVRRALENVGKDDPLADWIDTDDWNGPMDGLHYNDEGYKELGKAFAEKTVKLLKKE